MMFFLNIFVGWSWGLFFFGLVGFFLFGLGWGPRKCCFFFSEILDTFFGEARLVVWMMMDDDG